MWQIQTANLPQEQRHRLDPEFLANEQSYLQLRDSLLPQYRGQWVAVQSGKVIAAGPSLMDVMDRASAFGPHPFIALVGAEDAAVFRVRGLAFAYDQAKPSAFKPGSPSSYEWLDVEWRERPRKGDEP